MAGLNQKSIALKFIPGENKAPEVLINTEGSLADLIRKLAEKNDIPIIRDEGLANVLSLVPEGEEIPENLYKAVAAIYRFIQKIEKDLN
ncbi:MAG: EscU/YscU/HrcU family type III secretion system export apparatus switch protein [Leptospiraceae bacterium]|nr:EscU/YscU/HrcU family type III secretion system export apparatus switch protein [Leptospiraceae bacterium]MCP5500865.1 EscU/YscU/HrcU family type III secretion system export apparatus switch protein [Leptospiraceae bacterium]